MFGALHDILLNWGTANSPYLLLLLLACVLLRWLWEGRHERARPR